MVDTNIDAFDQIVIKCLKESFLLDKNKGNINNFKIYLQNLMILNQLPQFQSYESTTILKLLEKLYSLQFEHKKIILFFYKNNCKPSSDFIDEWKKLKDFGNGKYKFIALNCEDSKNQSICSLLNIYEYPMIKYINNNNIHNYFGEMTSSEIIKTFHL